VRTKANKNLRKHMSQIEQLRKKKIQTVEKKRS
jgi:hypothetical protein